MNVREGDYLVSCTLIPLPKTTPALLFGAVFALVLTLGSSFSVFAQDAATPAPATADNSQPAPRPSAPISR